MPPTLPEKNGDSHGYMCLQAILKQLLWHFSCGSLVLVKLVFDEREKHMLSC